MLSEDDASLSGRSIIVSTSVCLVTRSKLIFSYSDVLSAALDAGTSISTILIYFWYGVISRHVEMALIFHFSLQYPQNGRIGEHNILQWWGNTVYKNTSDWNALPLRELQQGETFGYVSHVHYSEPSL